MPDEGGRQTLSDAEIDAIVKRLKAGQFLDDQLRGRLFRVAKELELTYAGKKSRTPVGRDRGASVA